jgi:hypothetical protein
MSCSINKEDLIDYIYGELDENKKNMITEHIKSCPECEKEIAILQNERSLLKEWKINTPNIELKILEQKESLIIQLKECFDWLLEKPLRLGYVTLIIAVGSLFILSLINFEFKYNKSEIYVSMSIFGKKKSNELEETLLSKMAGIQQETINFIMQELSENRKMEIQERNQMFSQLIEHITKQRETDMLLINENLEYFGSFTAKKFIENDEILENLVYIAKENLIK